MAALVKPASLFFLFVFLVISVDCVDDTLSEELYISSLNDGHVLSHFQFTTLWNSSILKPKTKTCKNSPFPYLSYPLFTNYRCILITGVFRFLQITVGTRQFTDKTINRHVF